MTPQRLRSTMIIYQDVIHQIRRNLTKLEQTKSSSRKYSSILTTTYALIGRLPSDLQRPFYEVCDRQASKGQKGIHQRIFEQNLKNPEFLKRKEEPPSQSERPQKGKLNLVTIAVPKKTPFEAALAG